MLTERGDVIRELNGGDVVGEIDQQRVFVVRTSRRGRKPRPVVPLPSRSGCARRAAGPHVLGDLSNEAVGDDGDVLNARPGWCPGIIDDGALVNGKQGLLRVAGERAKRLPWPPRSDGLDVHMPRNLTLFKAPPVPKPD